MAYIENFTVNDIGCSLQFFRLARYPQLKGWLV